MKALTDGVLAALMTESGWAEYSNLVSPELFPDTTSRTLYGYIRALHEAGHANISALQLEQYVLAMNTLNGDRAQEFTDGIPKAPTESSGEVVRTWVSRQLLAQAAQYTASNLHSLELDPAVVLDYATRAMEVRHGHGPELLDFGKIPLPGESSDRPGIVPLGVSTELDTSLGGGIAAGELGILLAPPARGKTSVLCTIGAMAARRGIRPLHITLEISGIRVARRYECAWTRTPLVELIKRPADAANARQLVASISAMPAIKDWSYAEVSPHDVHALVTKMRRQFTPPGLVIIDYLELMVPNKTKFLSRREQRHVWGQLGRDIRAMAVDLQVPVLTAWQVNREGSQLDRIGMEHVSECWDIVKHADTLIALDQTPSEAQNHVMMFSILKQRDSTVRRSVRTYCNLDRCEIRDPTPVWTPPVDAAKAVVSMGDNSMPSI